MDKAKVEAAIKRARVHIGELVEDVDTLEALLLGEQTPRATALALLGDFASAWGQRYPGQRYVLTVTKELPQALRLLKVLPLAELSARLRSYLKSPVAFHVNARHPFLMFASSVNEWTGLNREVDLLLTSPASDCRHAPPCRSDQEHTKRRAAELREPIL